MGKRHANYPELGGYNPVTRQYDVMTDEPDATAPPYTPWPDVRLQALRCALEAAKLGVSYDIYATAIRYAAWLSGGEPDAPPVLPFQARLQALVDECRKSGEVDDDLVIHTMQVVMGIPTGSQPLAQGAEMPPDWPPDGKPINSGAFP